MRVISKLPKIQRGTNCPAIDIFSVESTFVGVFDFKCGLKTEQWYKPANNEKNIFTYI